MFVIKNVFVGALSSERWNQQNTKCFAKRVVYYHKHSKFRTIEHSRTTCRMKEIDGFRALYKSITYKKHNTEAKTHERLNAGKYELAKNCWSIWNSINSQCNTQLSSGIYLYTMYLGIKIKQACIFQSHF